MSTQLPKIMTHLAFDRTSWRQMRHEQYSAVNLNAPSKRDQLIGSKEIEDIYLPLAQLIAIHVAAHHNLQNQVKQFLKTACNTPYIIGINGGIAAGKSVLAETLQIFLSGYFQCSLVDVIASDNFLYSDKILEDAGLMHRKGFPESYDQQKFLLFLQAVKSGSAEFLPQFDYHRSLPDILIIEGFNVLQNEFRDFFDFTVFIDAKTAAIKNWFIHSVATSYQESIQGEENKNLDYLRPNFLFYLTPEELFKYAERMWREVHEINWVENILPLKQQANIILLKDDQHAVEKVYLRKKYSDP